MIFKNCSIFQPFLFLCLFVNFCESGVHSYQFYWLQSTSSPILKFMVLIPTVLGMQLKSLILIKFQKFQQFRSQKLSSKSKVQTFFCIFKPITTVLRRSRLLLFSLDLILEFYFSNKYHSFFCFIHFPAESDFSYQHCTDFGDQVTRKFYSRGRLGQYQVSICCKNLTGPGTGQANYFYP